MKLNGNEFAIGAVLGAILGAYVGWMAGLGMAEPMATTRYELIITDKPDAVAAIRSKVLAERAYEAACEASK